MKILLILIVLFVGCDHACKCGCSKCGPDCKDRCDDTRCVIGDRCCDKCTCAK